MLIEKEVMPSEKTFFPQQIHNILEEFVDVFLEEFPKGLPPIRGNVKLISCQGLLYLIDWPIEVI